MGKRRPSKTRGGDCKREKVSDQENDCEKNVREEEPKKEEPKEEECEISEKKLKSCTPKILRDLLREIGEKYYRYLEGNQTKGCGHQGVIAITSKERKYEDELFEQLSYHLRKLHGRSDAVADAIYGSQGRPKDFSVYWNEAQLGKYKTTCLGEVLEKIFKTYEIGRYALIAEKGEVILQLLEKFKLLLKSTHQLPRNKLKIHTENSKVSIDEQKKRWEDEGETITKEVFKDFRALGVTMKHKVTNIDKRAERVVVDLMNREIRIPKDDENNFGNPKNVNSVKRTNEKIVNIIQELEKRLEQEYDSVEEIKFVKTLLEKLKDIEQIQDDIDKNKSFEKVIQTVFEQINRSIDPGEEEQLFLTMDSEELRETYREALEDVLGRLNAGQYARRPDKVTEMVTMVEESFEKIRKNTKDSSKGTCVSMGTGAKVSADGDDDDEECVKTSDEGWNIVGKFKVLAVKITNTSVQCNENAEPENMNIELFKVSLIQAHAGVSEVCVEKDGIQDILPQLAEAKEHLGDLVDDPEFEEKKWETITTVEKVKRLDSTLNSLVNLLVTVLTEIELAMQYPIESSKRIVKTLSTTENPNMCFAAIIQATDENVTNYREMQQWKSLPKALKPETFRIIKEVVRALTRHRKYKLAFKICLHVTRLKAMWKAGIIMKVTIVRFAELKALEIAVNTGQKEDFTKKNREDLSQMIKTLKEFSRIDVAKGSLTRQNPNPELMEDVFEEVEAKVAKHRKESQEMNKENPEGWEAYQSQENELIRVLCKTLRRNAPTKFITLAIPIFKEYPVDCIEHGPVDGKERVEFYEAQLEETSEEDPYERPVEYLGFEAELPDDGFLETCTGSGGMECITKYPGLKDANEERKILVIAEVIIQPQGENDINGKNDFEAQIRKESYGGSLQDPRALHFEREMSRRRATFTGNSLLQNSNLSILGINGSELKESEYSCGKGCKLGDQQCPSGKKNITEVDRKREADFNIYQHGMCMKEWHLTAKSHVNVHTAAEVFDSSANFDGEGIFVEQLAVANHDKKIIHQVVRAVKLCILLDKKLAALVITYWELLSDRPLIVSKQMPEVLGDEDVNGKMTPVNIMRAGSLYVPRYVANAIWVVTNCTIGTNATDERAAVPGYRRLHMCKICNKMFLSPASLFIHLLYEEGVLGNVNVMDDEHTSCGRFTICKCRLVKKLRITEVHTEEEDFKHFKDEGIDKVGDRDFATYSLVQLNIVEFIDLSLMELHQFADMFVLLNQIGLNVFLPGRHFARRHNLYMSEYWQKTHVFGNLFKPIVVKTRGAEHNYVPGSIWKLEKHSSTRMTHRGEIFEISIREAAVELAESTNYASSCERFASVGCPGMAAQHGTTCKKRMKLLEDRSEEELRILKCFFNPHQEILHQNIIKNCLTTQVGNQQENHIRKIQILRIVKQAYQDRAVVNGIELPSLRKIPIGENPFNGKSLFDICCGEIINAMPMHVASESFVTNLNVVEGLEIFPGMEFTVNVPGTDVEPNIQDIINLVNRRIEVINEKGWRQGKGKAKSANAKRKCDEDFSVRPRMTEEVRQRKLAEIRKRIDKENAENIHAVRRRWWCTRCRLAGHHFSEHKGGCYSKLQSKKDIKDAEKEIRAEIEENTRKRVAKEMEELKESEDTIENSKNMEVEDETSSDESDNDDDDNAEKINMVSTQNIFDNQVIKNLDDEAINATQDESASVSTGREVLRELEPVLRPRKSCRLEVITEEEEMPKDNDPDQDALEDEKIKDDKDKIVMERMQQRTATQVNSDNKIKAAVESMIETWESNNPIDEVKKEQRILAEGIWSQTREMAKKGYSLVTFLKKVTENNNVEEADSEMNKIEGVSDEEEAEETTNEVFQEPLEEHPNDRAEEVSGEEPQADNGDTIEMGIPNVAVNPPEEPENSWCPGGVSEDCAEYICCGRSNCRNCRL